MPENGLKKNYTSVDPIYNRGLAAALALSGWRGWEFASLGEATSPGSMVRYKHIDDEQGEERTTN
jgi:hypothetical protein